MTKLRPPNRLNAQIRAEATEWLLRFSEGEVDAPAREEFNRWLRISPEHVRAYLRISAFWQEADHIDGQDTPRDIEALVARAKLEANVFPLEFGPRSAEGGVAGRMRDVSKRRIYAVAATALVAVAVGGWLSWQHYRDPVYSTDIGEQRTVNLPDGSTVTINAGSSIKIAYTGAQRAIVLRDGQALFKVAKNPARPFIVRSGTANIRAVGTQFDVNKTATRTIVTVVEGRVAVVADASLNKSSPRLRLSSPSDGEGSGHAPNEHAPNGTENHTTFLNAGQRVLVSAGTLGSKELPLTPTSVKIAEATAWTEGLLIFDGAPLSEVVQEFNRQNTKPLVLSDADLSDLKISGAFPASGSERIVRFLKERFHVAVQDTEREIRISRP